VKGYHGAFILAIIFVPYLFCMDSSGWVTVENPNDVQKKVQKKSCIQPPNTGCCLTRFYFSDNNNYPVSISFIGLPGHLSSEHLNTILPVKLLPCLLTKQGGRRLNWPKYMNVLWSKVINKRSTEVQSVKIWFDGGLPSLEHQNALWPSKFTLSAKRNGAVVKNSRFQELTSQELQFARPVLYESTTQRSKVEQKRLNAKRAGIKFLNFLEKFEKITGRSIEKSNILSSSLQSNNINLQGVDRLIGVSYESCCKAKTKFMDATFKYVSEGGCDEAIRKRACLASKKNNDLCTAIVANRTALKELQNPLPLQFKTLNHSYTLARNALKELENVKSLEAINNNHERLIDYRVNLEKGYFAVRFFELSGALEKIVLTKKDHDSIENVWNCLRSNLAKAPFKAEPRGIQGKTTLENAVQEQWYKKLVRQKVACENEYVLDNISNNKNEALSVEWREVCDKIKKSRYFLGKKPKVNGVGMDNKSLSEARWKEYEKFFSNS
jgi:hypothetical protein